MKADVLVLATLATLCSILVYTDACSCMLSHPQQHYCNSDFVILARVKRERIHADSRIYKVRVRREYKISEKGTLALKSGRLITAVWDSMCGTRLQPGKLYVLSGRIFSLKAYINLCNMAVEWDTLTRRQRKGLKLMYKHGCSCQIKRCLATEQRCPRHVDSCNWGNDCETKEGICMRQANNSCMWTRNRALAKCTKEWRKNLTANASHKREPTLLYHLP
ncbi:hypothetical protein NQ315_011827 [Exocentrus adspersus]|uniref:NTR domain-containing protein n=1 Tax=Exocentrus adspersus TaxID=1586481 RepID=A0AAV8W254_9CUCU|nr:hypothetical protein NQ315_011827 [Exocentrus adspersus]